MSGQVYQRSAEDSRNSERMSVGSLGLLAFLCAVLFIVFPITNALVVSVSFGIAGLCGFIFVMNETLHPQEHPFADAVNIGKLYVALMIVGAVFTFLDHAGFEEALHTITVVFTLGGLVCALGLFVCTLIIYDQYRKDLADK